MDCMLLTRALTIWGSFPQRRVFLIVQIVAKVQVVSDGGGTVRLAPVPGGIVLCLCPTLLPVTVP